MKNQPALIPVRQMQMQMQLATLNIPAHFDEQLRHDVVQILAALLLTAVSNDPTTAAVEVHDEDR